MPRDRNFTILPGPDRMVRLPPEVIAPITGYGQQIAPQTFVVNGSGSVGTAAKGYAWASLTADWTQTIQPSLTCVPAGGLWPLLSSTSRDRSRCNDARTTQSSQI